MKTRIRMTEQNNGTVKYICESASFKNNDRIVIWTIYIFFADYLLFPLFPKSLGAIIFTVQIVITAIIALFYRNWTVMRKSGEQCRIQAIFDNLQEAKDFIDSELKKESDTLSVENGNKIKKEIIIKHP